MTQHPDRDRSEPARYAGEGGPDTDSWRCSCGHWRPVTGSYGCADCGDGQPDSWDRIEDPATQPPADSEGSAEPLSEVVVSNALDEAWLESNDARGVARPPDLARHLHDALNDYVAIEATERAASPVADSSERCAECGGLRCPTCGSGCVDPLGAHPLQPGEQEEQS